MTPILTVVHKAVSGSRYIRKYVRSVILPPLKDVHTRPEEGNTIRNQLCRLLTTPITHVRDLTAEILLILCKENGMFDLLFVDDADCPFFSLYHIWNDTEK